MMYQKAVSQVALKTVVLCIVCPVPIRKFVPLLRMRRTRFLDMNEIEARRDGFSNHLK